MIALSADRYDAMTDSLKNKDLGYRLFSDNALNASRAFGIAHQLSPTEVKQYLGYGIDLEEASGETHHQLPVPSVFLVEAGGKVRWVSSNPDYTVRPPNAEILEAARRLSKTAPD